MSFLRNKIIIAIISLFSGGLIGFFATHLFLENAFISENDLPERQGGFTFINPLLSCDLSENKQFTEYEPIESKFNDYINQNISNGNAQDISVYFRGLNSGKWSGVNENDQYSPASLSKVPLMIAWLKEAESSPNILSHQIIYHQTIDGNAIETYKPKKFIEDGKTYSVNELLQYMILYSDNNAAQLLRSNVDENSLAEVYSDLGIPVYTSDSQDVLTPKMYSYIFRVLYNATYISRSLSQYALEMLSAVDFSQGIKAGVPANISSAQKFGERTVINKDPVTGVSALAYRELHDCGIVYYPHNPYLLCVMTKGNDFTKLSKVISDISALVYKETETGVLKI